MLRVTLAAAAVVALTAGGVWAGNFTRLPSYVYSAAWAVDPVDGTLFHVAAQAATRGWTGIGFAEEPGMYPADSVVGWLGSNGVGVLSDSYNRAYAQPALDTSLGGRDDLVGISVERATNSAGAAFNIISFSRKLDTGDSFDVLIADRNIYLLWAYGADGSVNEAICTYSRHFEANFAPTNFLLNGGERATRADLLERLAEWREAAAAVAVDEHAPAVPLMQTIRNSTIPVCVVPSL
jgi:hypothetical protein